MKTLELILVLMIILTSCDNPNNSKSNNNEQIKSNDFSVEDIEVWGEKLKKMEKAFKDISEKEMPIDIKIVMWEKFISSFNEKNPHTDEDERMLNEAGQYVLKLKEEKKIKLKELASRKDNKSLEEDVDSLVEELEEKAKNLKSKKTLEEHGFSYIRTKTYLAGGQTNTVKEYSHENTGIKFILIPSGNFIMGSNDRDSEVPMHEVQVKTFLISKYEITQRQWEDVMGTSPWSREKYVEEGEDYAATYVSWSDAMEFCEEVGLRLPSEAEWEYACRAGTTTSRYWGEEMNGSYAWYANNAGFKEEEYAHKVGKKRPNAFGLHDMIGNVWEWCEDSWNEDYSLAPEDGSAWTTGSYSERVLRGASWRHVDIACRSTVRSNASTERRLYNIGFRVSFSP